MKIFPPLSLDEIFPDLKVPRDRFWRREQRFIFRLARGQSYEAMERLRGVPDQLSISKAARTLGCSKSTISCYLRSGVLRGHRVGRGKSNLGRLRISRQEIRRFIS